MIQMMTDDDRRWQQQWQRGGKDWLGPANYVCTSATINVVCNIKISKMHTNILRAMVKFPD